MPDHASVSSTGGLGTSFEQRVQAAFLIGLLTGSPVPCVPSAHLVRLAFQTTKLGYATDDLLAEARTDDGQTHRLLIQLKNNLTLSDNPLFEKVIGEFWRDYQASDRFDPAHDRLVLVKSGLNDQERNHVKVALNWARAMATSREFFLELDRSQDKRKRVEVFRLVLARVSGASVANEELWKFLRCVELLDYDYLNTGSVDEASLLHLIKLAKSERCTASEYDIWLEARGEAERLNNNGGSLELADLVDTTLYQRFATDRLHPVMRAVRQMADSGRAVTALLRNTIDGTHLPREASRAAVLEAIYAQPCVLVSGEAGVGKSAVVRDVLVDNFAGVPIFAFRADQFNVSHLSHVFTGLGIHESLSDMLAALALVPEKILLLDSAEKLLEADVDGAFLQLLALQPIGASCRLVLTARQYAVEALTYRYPILGVGRVIVPRLSDAELAQLSADRPGLAAVLQNGHLRELLRSLKYLELTSTLVRKAPQEDLSAISLPEFKNRLWQRIVEDAVLGAGLPQRRSEAFAAVALQRARQMALYVAPTGADAQALETLVRDDLLVREPDTWRYAPTHDVLEDLALTRFIRDQWQATGRPVAFFQALGHEPALRRGFRLWLSDLLAGEQTSEEALDLVAQVMAEPALTTYWRDEVLVATFRSSYAEVFFRRFEAELLRDSATLLRRCAHLLRTACRQQYASGQSDDSRLQPIGSGWSAFLQFSARHWEALAAWRTLLARVLLDWAPAIDSANEPLPVGAAAAKKLVFAILTEAEQGDEVWEEGSARALLTEMLPLAYELTELAQSEVRELLHRALVPASDEPAGWQRQQFYKQVLKASLSGLRTGHLCKYLPEMVVAIANRRWRITAHPGARLSASSDFAWSEQELQFGLVPHQGGNSPAGVYKTPIRTLLTYRPDVGLPFIVDFINYCTQTYSRYLAAYRPPNEALEVVTFTLADGTLITQQGNDVLWAAYRDTMGLPTLLSSVLMGVEQYLLDQAEHDSAPDYPVLRSAFRYLLTHTASVALTGVLVSVLLAYPEEVGAEWLPLLAVRQFFEWDFTRAMRELTALSPIDREIIFAQQRRHASNRLLHRTRYRLGLLDFVLAYQLPARQFTAQVYAALDQHQQELTDQSSLLWRQRLSDMDLRRWQVEELDETTGLATIGPTYEEAVQTAREDDEPRAAAERQRMAMASWIGAVLDGKAGGPPDVVAWESAYTYYTTPGRQLDSLINRLSGLAVIGLRYLTAQLTVDQRHWCYTTLHDSLTFRLDQLRATGIANTFDERHSLLDQQFVWQSFALLYAAATTDTERRAVELLLLRTVAAGPDAHQLAHALIHLREEYFSQFPDQLPAVAGRLLAYARHLRNDQLPAEPPYAYPTPWQDHSLARLMALLASPPPSWEPTAITLATHEVTIATRVAQLIPFSSLNPLAIGYVTQLTQLMLAALASPAGDPYHGTREEEPSLGYEAPEALAQYLGQYLLLVPYDRAEAMLERILATETQQPLRPFQRGESSIRKFIRKVLQYTVATLTRLVTENETLAADRTTHFWQLWAYLRGQAMTPAGRWLAPLVLLDVDWTATSRYWPPLESGRDEYLRALRELGDTDLRAGLRVLSTAGSRALLPAALPVVRELMEAHTDLLSLLFADETEQLAQRLFQQHLRAIKARPSLLTDFLWLLDALVIVGSSVGYLMREDVITFKAT